jgi:hypothetical protein
LPQLNGRERAVITVEKALRTVERTARESVAWPAPPAIPRKYRLDAHRAYRPVDHQVDALEQLEASLAADPRFEYMKDKEIEEAVSDFANNAFVSRDASHVAGFLEKHGRDPLDLMCFFPVEGLTVHREVTVGGATLIPKGEVEVPEIVLAPELGTVIGAVIGASCYGTSGTAMMGRARAVAEHALRLLRASLREHRSVIDQQLRFRLGTAYWFAGGGGGFHMRPGEGIEFELREELLELALSAPIAALPASGGTRVEQSANRALDWFERAQLTSDRLVELLYLFFALEAILGDTSEKLKGERLTLRRAVLSHTQGSGFTHPAKTYWLYGKIRSTAVHGEDVPEVSERQVSDFASEVRHAINEFLTFAEAQGFTKRGQVVKALDEDSAQAEIKARFLRG